MFKFISKLGLKTSKAAANAQMAQAKGILKIGTFAVKMIIVLFLIIGLLILKSCLPSWDSEETAMLEEPTITTAEQLEASVEARLTAFEQQMTARFGPITIAGTEDKLL
jgi:hypothetical protein